MRLQRHQLLLPNVISTLLPKGKPTRFNSFVKRKIPCFSDGFLLIFVCLLAFGLSEYYHQFVGPLKEKVEIDLSIWSLPKYTFFSLTRGMVAYVISLIVSIGFGVWAGKDRAAEKLIVPLFDLIQSIPILGFMPGVILLMVAFFPKSNMGLELAAIILMFQNQAWNMGFGVYHSIRTVPLEKLECAKAYLLSNYQCLKWVELPFSMLSLVWNSIMGVAGGWFLLMVNEAFQLGSRDFRLPGLGAYMSVAADKGDIPAMILAIVFMIILILFLNTFLWNPLVVWAEKFRIEDVKSGNQGHSIFLSIIESSYCVQVLRKKIAACSGFLQDHLTRVKRKPKFRISGLISKLALMIIFFSLFWGLFYLIVFLKSISLDQWAELFKMAFLTLSRVMICVVIGLLLGVPFGIAIGLSDKLRGWLQPIIQVAASFPATLLFPVIIFLLKPVQGSSSLEVVGILLMLMGSVWYILFNVIAGARALPEDLKEVAVSFHLKRFNRLRWLYLPGIFPYLITGMISAAGGAWNASIVAEYISYNGKVSTTPGLGSLISESAASGNIPLLTAGVCVMVIVVTFINLSFWLRLYHYSEKRFTLNY